MSRRAVYCLVLFNIQGVWEITLLSSSYNNFLQASHSINCTRITTPTAKIMNSMPANDANIEEHTRNVIIATSSVPDTEIKRAPKRWCKPTLNVDACRLNTSHCKPYNILRVKILLCLYLYVCLNTKRSLFREIN
jgi:hypothetical protein